MKKISLFIFWMISGTLCISQKEIHFKVGYLPDREYSLSQSDISENRLQYIGSAETLENLKENGVKNPTVSNDTTFLKSISHTGSLTGDSFPFQVEMLASSNEALSPGTKFIGSCIHGVIQVDSMISPTLSQEDKDKLLAGMESMLNQVTFPDKKMRVGDSFEQNIPFTFPIADVTIKMEINSIYTLKKVKNGFGYFDLAQVYILKYASKDYDLALDGKGKGQIDFDIENHFFTKLSLDMVMDLTIEMEIFTLELKAKSSTNQTTQINKLENQGRQ